MFGKIMVVLAISLLPCAVFCHAPSDIQLKYDMKTKTLSSVVVPSSANTGKHYANMVKVYVDWRCL